MKRFFLLAFASLAIVAISCSKKDTANSEPSQNESEFMEISFIGVLDDFNPSVKSYLKSTISPVWGVGDPVYVFDNTKCLGHLTTSILNNDPTQVRISGKISKPSGNASLLTMVYGTMIKTEPDVVNSKVTLSMTGQNDAELPFIAYSVYSKSRFEQTDTELKLNSAEKLQFNLATSLMKVGCTGLQPSKAVSSISVSNINTACVLEIKKSALPVVSGGLNGILVTTVSGNDKNTLPTEDGEAFFTVAIPVQSQATKARSLSLTQGNKVYSDENFTKDAYNAGNLEYTICQMAEKEIFDVEGSFESYYGNPL